ncbi:MAG: hypothetical protein KIT22_15250 [Verrucomicrobiae bacterium]|nr:hypothetical protein [Verrucomicrobiae bacterium]
MITARNLRELLDARPFRPFRIFLTDGSRHDVPLPEFAWVFGGRIFVGEASGSEIETGTGVKQLSLLHVARIEELPFSKSAS